MPSTKKKPRQAKNARKSAKKRSESIDPSSKERSDSKHDRSTSEAAAESDSEIDPNLSVKVKYLLELLNEDRLLADLRRRCLKGKSARLSPAEEITLGELDVKSEAAQKATNELKRVNEMLQKASTQRDTIKTMCDNMPSELVTYADKKLQHSILKQSERDLRTALSKAKDELLSLLEQPWAQRMLLATAALGAVGWFGHRAYLTTASATSELLREANKMTETIQATTELIQTTSHEGAKWTFGALGGAVGAANGLLLSTLLPSFTTKSTTASTLTSAVLGMYGGWRSMR